MNVGRAERAKCKEFNYKFLNHMAEVNQREYALLNEIAQDSMVTQANLSSRLDIAVGSVNWHIKRFITRGWIKVTHLDRTRLKYHLTSEGMSILTQRAIYYAHNSLKVYGEYRAKARALVAELKQKGINQVNIEGNDEAMDILRLTCMEGGISIADFHVGATLKTNGQDYFLVSSADNGQ